MTKASLGTIVGGVSGALSGAATFGLPTYFSTESGFMGPYSDWAGIAAIVGAIYGVGPGAVIGFLVGRLGATKLVGALIGSGVGLIILLLLFEFGLDPGLDSELFVVGLECIPIGGIIGLILAAINIHRGSRGATQQSLDRGTGRVFRDLID